MTAARTLTSRGAARRDALLDAAISVVAGTGSGGLTHRAVAATAEVSLASVTYHFASIQALRTATFARALAVLDDELASSVAQFGGTIERMPRVFADYVVSLLSHHREAVVTVNELIVAASHDDELQPTFHAYQDHLAGLLAPCVGGQDSGLMVAAALQGLMLSALTYQGADGVDIPRWRDAVVDMISRLSSH